MSNTTEQKIIQILDEMQAAILIVSRLATEPLDSKDARSEMLEEHVRNWAGLMEDIRTMGFGEHCAKSVNGNSLTTL